MARCLRRKPRASATGRHRRVPGGPGQETHITRTRSLIALAAGAALLLAGCWEDADVTLHEAGEYKGQRDPLLTGNAAQRAEALAVRFEQVQADR